MDRIESEQNDLFDREKLALLLLLRPAIDAAIAEPDPVRRRAAYGLALLGLDFGLQEVARWGLLHFALRTSENPPSGAVLEADVQAGIDAARTALLKVLDTIESGTNPRPEVAAEDAVTTAFSVAQQRAAARAGTDGVVQARRWHTVEDGRVRPAHDEANLQRLSVHGVYLVGGEEARYPRDPDLSPDLRLGCRCFEQYRVKGAWV